MWRPTTRHDAGQFFHRTRTFTITHSHGNTTPHQCFENSTCFHGSTRQHSARCRRSSCIRRRRPRLRRDRSSTPSWLREERHPPDCRCTSGFGLPRSRSNYTPISTRTDGAKVEVGSDGTSRLADRSIATYATAAGPDRRDCNSVGASRKCARLCRATRESPLRPSDNSSRRRGASPSRCRRKGDPRLSTRERMAAASTNGCSHRSGRAHSKGWIRCDTERADPRCSVSRGSDLRRQRQRYWVYVRRGGCDANEPAPAGLVRPHRSSRGALALSKTRLATVSHFLN